jgi:hypothetical protein
MWPFKSNRLKAIEYDERVLDELDKLANERHKGQLLDDCANDVERRSLCLQWAGQARNAWFQGRRESIQDMLMSKDRRYKYMSVETRKKIGEIKWSKSIQAKELASVEQMYSRWAVQYAGGPGAK